MSLQEKIDRECLEVEGWVEEASKRASIELKHMEAATFWNCHHSTVRAKEMFARLLSQSHQKIISLSSCFLTPNKTNWFHRKQLISLKALQAHWLTKINFNMKIKSTLKIKHSLKITILNCNKSMIIHLQI